MVKVLVQKLNSSVKLPEYKTSGSSGMDLMAFVESPIKINGSYFSEKPSGISKVYQQ